MGKEMGANIYTVYCTKEDQSNTVKGINELVVKFVSTSIYLFFSGFFCGEEKV